MEFNKDPNYTYLIAGVFFVFFILLTPLGLFNDWVDPLLHIGHYSVINIDEGDDAGYYAFLRSAFFDGDWDFFNEHHYAHFENFTSSGYAFNNWQIGQAFLYFPFFLLGHGTATILNSLGYSVSVDGYSFPYSMATALASQTYLFSGLLILFKLLRRHFPYPISFLVVILIWLATPLIFYTFIRQRMAHTTEFFTGVVFLYVWDKNRTSLNTYSLMLFGVILAALCSIRIINAIYLFFFLMDRFFICKKRSLHHLVHFQLDAVKVIGTFLIFFLPQILAWYKIHGFPYPPNIHRFTQSAGQIKSFPELWNDAISTFFGNQWGLILSAPILLTGILGWFFIPPTFRKTRLPFGFFFILLLGANLIFPPPVSFGERYFIPILPLAALGLASLMAVAWTHRMGKQLVFLFATFCIFEQYFLVIQYKINLNYNDPNYSLNALKQIPNILTNQPELLLRSSNFIRIITVSTGWPLNDYKDMAFLAGWPTAQGILMLLVIALSRHFQLPNLAPHLSKIFLALFLTVLFLLTLIEYLAPEKEKDEIIKRTLYKNLINQGDLSVKSSKAIQGLKLYREAKELFPHHWTPLLKEGLILQGFGNVVLAEKFYRKALSIFPDHPIALREIGNILIHYKKIPQAKNYFLRGIQVDPSNASLFRDLGSAYIQMNEYNVAKKFLSRSLILNPHSGKTHSQIAKLYLRTQKLDKAKQHIVFAIKYGRLSSDLIKLGQTYGLVFP